MPAIPKPYACAACGKSFPTANAVAEHVFDCPEHPVAVELSKVRAEVERLRARLARIETAANDVLCELRDRSEAKRDLVAALAEEVKS